MIGYNHNVIELITLLKRHGVSRFKSGDLEVEFIQIDVPNDIEHPVPIQTQLGTTPNQRNILDNQTCDCGCPVEHHMDGAGPCLNHATCHEFKARG